jgi:RNA polymerase sigma-70 factor (ECF subfamily)
LSSTRTTIDRDAFAELYEQYMPKVYRYIRYRVNNTQEAEDLTSATFEKALENIKRYSSEKAKFSTWIYSIARNTVIDYYRVKAKRKTTPLEEATEIEARDLPIEEEFLRREDLRRLHICLKDLPPMEQEIISLKFGAELTNRQIARMVGQTESNVGTRLCRAVKKLRDNFKE